jgi:hypothetical protein
MMMGWLSIEYRRLRGYSLSAHQDPPSGSRCDSQQRNAPGVASQLIRNLQIGQVISCRTSWSWVFDSHRCSAIGAAFVPQTPGRVGDRRVIRTVSFIFSNKQQRGQRNENQR